MSRHGLVRAASRLDERLDALNTARQLADGVLPLGVLDAAYGVLERASSRRSLSPEHTVVGFFGATGSGKSSLFNAVGSTGVARVSARRPTTAQPLAGVWGSDGSGPLLDWLDVQQRYPLLEVPDFADEQTGLILLDLPDFDSTQGSHRETVQRMVGLVDVLVWVVDPQKYADAALHHDFLEPLSAHGAVTIVVLNQIDRLPSSDVVPVTESLKGILARDGLDTVRVLAASAVTGAGLAEVRSAIRAVALGRVAISQRLEADVDTAARQLAAASGEGRAAGVTPASRNRLTDELSEAANVPLVADAVGRSYKRASTRRTGWPVTRWLVRFRPDPLRRLNLGRSNTNPAVNRTSLPPAGAPERARTDAAVREFADAASAGAPGPWRASIRAAAREAREDLPDALDQAIAGTELSSGRKPWWWPVFNAVQWLALLAAVAGLGWLGVLAGLGYLQLPVPETPRVQGWPLPTLLILGGAVLGIFLALTGRVIAAAAARLRARSAGKRLRAGVDKVASQHIVEPVQRQVDRLDSFAAALKKALGK